MAQRPYDIISVGGGIAGCALATVMARAGARVLVLEREWTFRDRVRGEWLAPWGVDEARALNLYNVFRTAGAHRLPAVAGRSGTARRSESETGEVALTFSHPDLQEAMVASAIDAGATVIRGARVVEVLDGRARVRWWADGPTLSANARVVVGADGRSSLVRTALGKKPRLHRRARVLAGVRVGGLTGDPSVGYFIMRSDSGAHASLFPQGGGYGRAYLVAPGGDPSAYPGRDDFQRFAELSIAVGVPAEVYANAFAAGPLAAFVADDSWVEHPAGRSLALIGDAAGVSDPTWGMGIALALRDVRALTGALLREDDWDAATNAYAEEHDEYFSTILTAENWQSELQLESGPAAARRRKHVMALWSQEPDRALDLPGRGPAIDVSDEARRRFFGEDVPTLAA